MKVTVCRDLSDRALSYDVEPGTLSDIFTSLGLGNAVALVNGKIAAPETVVSDEDVVFIRQVPKGIDPVSVLLIVAGVVLLTGVVYGGYQLYQMRKQMEEYKEGLSSFGDSVTNLPNVKGANNVRALDRSIPYIIGKARVAPYVLSEGVISITGASGHMIRQVPYILGYSNLVLRKCFSNGRDVYTFTGNTPQQGRFLVPDITQGSLWVAQTGVQYTTPHSYMRNTYVTIDAGDKLLKADDPNYTALTYTLPENTAEAKVFLMFNGLRKYSSDGKNMAHSITLRLTYSINGGTTWNPLTSIGGETGDYVVSYNRSTQFRKLQSLILPFATTKHLTEPIQIRIECRSNTTSGALEDVFVQSILALTYDPQASIERNDYVFLPVVDEDVAKKCCIVGLNAGARNSIDEDAFRNLAFIVEGMARTWNGTTWGNRATTRNPASWLLEVLTSDVHPQSKIGLSEIDLDSFGELYEYCEEEGIEVNMVILDGEPKEKIIQKICDVCYSTLYKNLDGKIAVATDKHKENAIAIINTQNCFSFTNKKDLTPQVDGLRITFINEDTDYEQDAYEVMRPGTTKDANSKIRALTVDGITKYEQIVKYAWRLMAIESARPKVTTVEIGNEGVYYTPLSKVLVQHPSLKNGLGSAEIKAVLMIGTNIIGLDLYEPVAYDSTEASGFGAVIQCVTDSYSSILAKAYTAVSDGLVSTITFTVPIDTTTASVIPHAGDIFSYGLLDAGEFNTITNEMMITNMSQTERGYRLDLVDYNEAIYEYGEIPVYTPNITPTRITKYVPAAPPPATLDDVAKAIQIVTTNGDPEWIPDTVSVVQAVASQNEIAISWEWAGSGIANNIKRFIVELTKNGTDWAVIAEPNSNTAAYSFDRVVDGYPESGDLSAWRVRVKAENVYGVTSIDWRTSAINTTYYKTWIMSVPAIHAKASGRSVDLQLYKENDFYGDYEFRVQISKDAGENWNELGDSSHAWIDESSYKGPGEYTELIFEAYRQVLPLTGQASDEPEDTEYWYRVALYHKQTTQITSYTSPFIVVCKPSSAKDLVSGAVKNAQLATGAVTHDKIAARTIQTENLFVTARSKINTLSNADDGISGWTAGTRFADGSRFGLELVAQNHDVYSDEFTVEPNEIVEVSFGLQVVDPAGSTGSNGIFFGCTREQTFTSYVWDTTTKKWEESTSSTNAYFIHDYQGSSIQFVKTFVLGSNVNIKDVPAPAVSTAHAVYCLQLSVGDVKCLLRSGHNPVNNGYTWRLYQPLAVTIGQSKIVAEQIEVKTLSAINSHLGEIKGDTEDYKLVMGSGGTAEEGTFLLGATTDESYLRRWKEGGIWKMAIKLATFFVDAVSSKVLGRFQVRNAADTATALDVDPSNPVAVAVAGGMSVTGGASVTGGMGVGGGLTIDGGTAWHSGNDGSGSGLDADYLDGLDSSVFPRQYTFAGEESSVDLNTITDIGFYSTTDNAYTTTTFLNTPVGVGAGGFTLLVTRIGSSYALQLFQQYGPDRPPLYKRESYYSGGVVWGPWIKMWSDANDGSGSGLDADLLDGQHGSYYAPIHNPSFSGIPRVGTADGNFPLAQIYTGNDVIFKYLPIGSYICVYDDSQTNRPRNASYPVYLRVATNRDYTFDSGDAGGVVTGTWRCCGVSGSGSNSYTYLMRRVA